MITTKDQHASARTGRSIAPEPPPTMHDEEDLILTPEDLLEAIGELRLKIEQTLAPLRPDAPVAGNETPSIDTDVLLQAIGELRLAFERTLTPEERAALPQALPTDETAPYMYSAANKELAIEDFAFETALETVELIAEQAHALAEMKSREAYGMCLRIYYAMEDAYATNPEDTEVLEHMENMRRAHLSQYGRAIPERETKG